MSKPEYWLMESRLPEQETSKCCQKFKQIYVFKEFKQRYWKNDLKKINSLSKYIWVTEWIGNCLEKCVFIILCLGFLCFKNLLLTKFNFEFILKTWCRYLLIFQFLFKLWHVKVLIRITFLKEKNLEGKKNLTYCVGSLTRCATRDLLSFHRQEKKHTLSPTHTHTH